ncbi:MAG: type II toxin-antitoxin system VapB family antitoxin [Pseudomonadota bacterium]
MALNIKSSETERVVRELARRTGLSITEAVHRAAEEKLRLLDAARDARLGRMTPAQREKLQRLQEITRHAAALPVVDARTDDEILGYNDRGTFE